MDDIQLKKLQKAILLITDEIDRICRKYNIKYSLVGGSMLGAIRHKGFIPWDDDMDIGMLRQDYDKFLEICKTELNEEFDLQTNTNDQNYVYGFAKILLKDTYLVQFGHEKTKSRKGIYVDIFPLDNVPEDMSKRKKQRKKNYLYIKMLDRKFTAKSLKGMPFKKKLAFMILDVMNIFCSQQKLIQKLNSNMILYNESSTENVCNMAGYYGYDRETIPLRYFKKLIQVPFEDRTYYIMADYDAYLTDIYKDYMKLPPVEQRRTHGFQSLDFGPYDVLC